MLNFFVWLDNYSGLTFGMDHNIRRWNIDIGCREGVITGHSNRVVAVFKLDENQLVTAGIDRTLRLWSIPNHFVCTSTIKIFESYPLSLDISKDNRLLLSAEEYNIIRIYDLAKEEGSQKNKEYQGRKVWEYYENEEICKVRWVSTPGTIFVETVSNVKIMHLFLNFNVY